VADNNTVARPYAEAIFEVAQESGLLDELSGSFGVAKALMANGEVEAFLAHPALSDDERLKFLQDLFGKAAGSSSVFAGGSHHGTNFLKLLIENDRVGALPEMAEQFEALKAKVENSVDAVITSATPLSSQRQSEIATSLSKKLGRDVRVSTEIDENLIGGAVIRAGDVVIDGSLRARLEGLANALTK
jgi:F-type H+-transporting ATPase subunit delta